MSTAGLRWRDVARIGVVQAALGAVVVLMTSTLNRVMVVELGLPAAVPGMLVALHFAVQFALRPRFGFLSDASAARTPWIIGGLAACAAFGTMAAASVALMAADRTAGLALAVAAFLGLGAGVSAAGTPLLALLAEGTSPERRARAAAAVWLTMIAGFIVTTVAARGLLAPFSYGGMVRAVAMIAVAAALAGAVAVQGLEARVRAAAAAVGSVPVSRDAAAFRTAVRAVLADPSARSFTLFVLVSMLAYSAQDLILEPFAGVVFGLSPAESTGVSGLHQSGMLLGMLGAAALAARAGGTLRQWAAGGCLASTVAFAALAAAPAMGSVMWLKGSVFALGLGNGTFAVGAIGAMMALAARGADAGMRMGVFGAAQAIGFAVGGLVGALLADAARWLVGDLGTGYALVFVLEAACFTVAAALAGRHAEGERLMLTGDARAEPILGALG
jgi:BCD family chlorophyll transporter-like MFS transporter